MINPPDELLADLQTALPPEKPVDVPRPLSGQNGQADMEDNLYDRPEDIMMDRESMTNAVSSRVEGVRGGGQNKGGGGAVPGKREGHYMVGEKSEGC